MRDTQGWGLAAHLRELTAGLTHTHSEEYQTRPPPQRWVQAESQGKHTIFSKLLEGPKSH